MIIIVMINAITAMADKANPCDMMWPAVSVLYVNGVRRAKSLVLGIIGLTIHTNRAPTCTNSARLMALSPQPAMRARISEVLLVSNVLQCSN